MFGLIGRISLSKREVGGEGGGEQGIERGNGERGGMYMMWWNPFLIAALTARGVFQFGACMGRVMSYQNLSLLHLVYI